MKVRVWEFSCSKQSWLRISRFKSWVISPHVTTKYCFVIGRALCTASYKCITAENLAAVSNLGLEYLVLRAELSAPMWPFCDWSCTVYCKLQVYYSWEFSCSKQSWPGISRFKSWVISPHVTILWLVVHCVLKLQVYYSCKLPHSFLVL